MFGNKNKENGKVSNTNLMPSSTSHSLNSLVQGTVIEGSMQSETDLRIDGKVVGNINCRAKVIVGKTGYVDGEIKCQNAVIEGQIDGKIFVEDLLNIRESASVNGDVITKKLIVQSGAVFNVTCQMGKAQSNGIHPKSSKGNSIDKVQQKAKQLV